MTKRISFYTPKPICQSLRPGLRRAALYRAARGDLGTDWHIGFPNQRQTPRRQSPPHLVSADGEDWIQWKGLEL
jgi:hypothetical protein